MTGKEAINNLPVINASDIKPDDEWMQEDAWDEIYEKEERKAESEDT